jgi:hypothetical protein
VIGRKLLWLRVKRAKTDHVQHLPTPPPLGDPEADADAATTELANLQHSNSRHRN